MKQENKQNRKRKADKTYVIAICLCVVLALAIVGAIVLPEPITAAVNLGRSKDFLSDEPIIKAVINAPMQSTGILADSEKVLSDNDAQGVSDRLYDVLKNVKYSSMEPTGFGVWKIKIVTYNLTEESRVYLDENAVYIENNKRLIKYSVSQEYAEAYAAFYSDINDMLK